MALILENERHRSEPSFLNNKYIYFKVDDYVGGLISVDYFFVHNRTANSEACLLLLTGVRKLKYQI